MWQLYATGHGIAIRSNFARLQQAIETDSNVFVGRVKYVDYTTGEVDLGTIGRIVGQP